METILNHILLHVKILVKKKKKKGDDSPQSHFNGSGLAIVRHITVMLVQGVLPMAACPRQAQPFMSFHILVFYLCISRKYDVSQISCLGLSDMKWLRM